MLEYAVRKGRNAMRSRHETKFEEDDLQRIESGDDNPDKDLQKYIAPLEQSSAFQTIRQELLGAADPKKRAVLQRFFKTGPGEYAEGDIFIGTSVPDVRKIARRWYARVTQKDLRQLMISGIHEHRTAALAMLIQIFEKQFSGSTSSELCMDAEACIDWYLEHLPWVSSWDLVDMSCYKLLGIWMLDGDGDREFLYDLARSGDLWKQRIAMITTMAFIRRRQYDDTLRIADLLLDHSHDLIHKAAGWMLREVGKQSMETEMGFLDERYDRMPRTMLRYAIEKFPEDIRKAYLRGTRNRA